MSEPRDADSVATRLRWLRGTLGLSQEQLARRLGVSFASVNRWESGRTRLSARAAAALGTDLTPGTIVSHRGGLGQASGMADPDPVTTEIVRNGHSGFVVDPDDPAAMVSALTSLVTDDVLWASMSAVALASAKELSWDSIAERCFAIYSNSRSANHQLPSPNL